MNCHPCFKCGSFDHTYHPNEDKMQYCIEEYCMGCDEKVMQPCTSAGCPMNYLNERKSKMTREEAIKQMKPSRWYGEDGMQGWLLDNLQALGLIKFEEEKKEKVVPKYLINEITHIYQYRQYGDIVIIDDQDKGGLEFWIGGRIVYKYHGKEGK